MDRLRARFNGYDLYQAGIPYYPSNFTRDSIISAILMQNPEMLRQQLSFCAERQGKKKSSYSGEEPGKIFHEYPSVKKRESSTGYNACDSSALFLIGHEAYQRLTGDKKFTETCKKNIIQAVDYIEAHLRQYAFIEDPKFSGSGRFALKVTYWKDSEIFGRKNGEPVYPVVYTLAHVQNMRALRSASFLLEKKELEQLVSKMAKYLMRHLFNKKTGAFYLAIDQEGPIGAISSDQLHALFYLDVRDIEPQCIEQVVESSSVLETAAGYRTLCEECAAFVQDKYHAKTVWPFEQAIINIGARRFGLDHVRKVSSRITQWLDTDPEIVILERKGFRKAGCDPLLLSIAAKTYFKAPRSEPQSPC